MNPDPGDLGKLHDIVVPQDVPWWPPAPGWYAVSALLFVVAFVVAFRRWKRWRADAYRRAALRELAASRTAGEIAALLRRAALAFAPREAIASLHGKAWTEWLEKQGDLRVPEEVRADLTILIYDPNRHSDDPYAFRRFARDWILRHDRTC